MLRSTTELSGCTIGATDGPIGSVKDVYFDDDKWVVRYLIVATGEWLSSRKVLISPMAIGEANWVKKILPVSITRTQVRACPGVDTEKPVSRQLEMDHLGHYGYPNYWDGGDLWGMGATPHLLMSGMGYAGTGPERAERRAQAEKARLEAEAAIAERQQRGNHHLRSGATVMHYRLHASDGDLGHIQDFLFDEESWAIRFMIVNTRNGWLDHHVLVAPQWITGFNWGKRVATVDLTRDEVEQSPPYKIGMEIDRQEELRVYRHYCKTADRVDSV